MTCCITVSRGILQARGDGRLKGEQTRILAWQFVSSWSFHPPGSLNFPRWQVSLHAGFCENWVWRSIRRFLRRVSLGIDLSSTERNIVLESLYRFFFLDTSISCQFKYIV